MPRTKVGLRIGKYLGQRATQGAVPIGKKDLRGSLRSPDMFLQVVDSPYIAVVIFLSQEKEGNGKQLVVCILTNDVEQRKLIPIGLVS